ncbi:MAG: response regulator [Candidatus Limnocylindria bacterium]
MGNRRPRVAVLDDDLAFVELMQALLSEEGFEPIALALDGADPVGSISGAGADVVLLDLQGVTEDGGFDLLRALRNDTRIANVPVLVCSADIGFIRDHAADLARMPAVAALEKPFRIDTLTGALQRLLSGELGPPPEGGPASAEAVAAVEKWLAHIGATLRWPVLDAWVPDTRGGMLRCAAAWCATEGLQPFAELSRRTHLPFGGGVPGRIWVSGRPAWIEDLWSDLNFPRLATARRVGLVSSAAVPVLDAGITVGVVAAYNTLRRTRDVGMLERLREAAQEAGPMLRAAAGIPEVTVGS